MNMDLSLTQQQQIQGFSSPHLIMLKLGMEMCNPIW